MTSEFDSNTVAIIGAGMAGLMCARTLRAVDVPVVVFDKGRGFGGRCATRRRDGLTFDHGPTHFTARSDAFHAAVRTWQSAGVAAPWTPRVVAWRGGRAEPWTRRTERIVGTPTMSAIGRFLASETEVRTETRVVAVEGEARSWALRFEDGAYVGPFSWLVLALPAPQACVLAPSESPLRDALAQLRLDPCLALMVEMARDPDVDFDAAHVEGSSLDWIVREASKPGRAAAATWVAHATASWSSEHIDAPIDDSVDVLSGALREVLGAPLRAAVLHRWRYARVTRASETPYLIDADRGLAACGDGCLGPRLESAWRSGLALGERIGE